MADIPTIARQRALNCEAKKHAYRQTQDGVVVSFVLHPQEIPDELALAPLGQRFILAMVALNDQDEPKEVMPNTVSTPKAGDNRQHNKPPASEDSATPALARRSWDEVPPAQQAGILCEKKDFQKFIADLMFPIINPNEIHAKRLVVEHCKVASRSEIKEGTAAAELWRDLVEKYRAWQHVPEFVG